MIKKEQLSTGSKYSNSVNESAFVGSRLEGKNRVSTMRVNIPVIVTNPTTGCCDVTSKTVSYTVKLSIPEDALLADANVALLKSKAYITALIGTDALLSNLAQGPIEWTIADIVAP